MAGIFDKMKLTDETEILVLNPPASFEPELARLRGVTVHRRAVDVKDVAFTLAFVTTPSEVETASRAVARKTKGDWVSTSQRA